MPLILPLVIAYLFSVLFPILPHVFAYVFVLIVIKLYRPSPRCLFGRQNYFQGDKLLSFAR